MVKNNDINGQQQRYINWKWNNEEKSQKSEKYLVYDIY